MICVYEKGILVYQDLMFACSFYQVDEYFLENVKRELEDNLARIGHHACLAALCGNNEIDGVYTVTGSTEPQTAALRKMFGSGEDPLPEQVRKVLWDNYTPLFWSLYQSSAKNMHRTQPMCIHLRQANIRS